MVREIVLASGLALVASLAACRAVIAAGLMDAPNLARKMHRQPTPTSGGLGIALGFGLAVLFLWLPDGLNIESCCSLEGRRMLAPACLAAATFLAIGFVDDRFPLGPRAKLAALALASLATAGAVAPVENLRFGLGVELELPFVLALAGSALWVFAMVNIVNFMDGANGLAMGSTAIGLIMLAIASMLAGVNSAAIIALCGAGALIGFLYWNFPRARLFAGDSGALLAGVLAAVCGLMAVRRGLTPIAPLLCFFPMLADALLTLVYRASRGRNLLNGHNEHFYQIGLRAGLSHRRVTIGYWAAAVHCGVIAIIASEVERGARAGAAQAHPLHAALDAAASFMPIAALVLLIAVALRVSGAVRRYQASRGWDEI